MSIQELVRRDLIHREQLGRARYGTSLHAYNGRSAILDAYEEALDLCQYLRQTIEELTIGGGFVGTHVSSVSASADTTPTAFNVHRAAAMFDHRPSDPATDGVEHQINLGRSTQTHEGAQRSQGWHDGVDVGVRPGPDCLAILLIGLSPSHVATAYDFVESQNRVLIGHGADDAHQRARGSILVLAPAEVETSFAFQKTANPSDVNILHNPQCINQGHCNSLNLAITLREQMNRTGTATSTSEDRCGPSCECLDDAIPEYGA